MSFQYRILRAVNAILLEDSLPTMAFLPHGTLDNPDLGIFAATSALAAADREDDAWRAPEERFSLLRLTYMRAYFDVDENDEFVTADGELISDMAYVRHLAENETFPYVSADQVWSCENCGETFVVDDDYSSEVVTGSRDNRTQLWCEDCCDNHAVAAEAGNGESVMCHDDIAVRHGNQHYTPQAWQHVGAECEHCGDGYLCIEGPDCSCSRDYDDDDDDDDDDRSCGIHSYHGSNPAALGYHTHEPHGVDSRAMTDVRYFGFELEVMPASGDIRPIARDDLRALSAWTTLQRDGSVAGGVEIISAPHTLDAVRKRLDGDTWQRALSRCRSGKHSSCGLHVHVSRTGLKPATLHALQAFHAQQRNQAFVDIIAQRGSVGYAKRLTDSDDRYSAVNLNNRATVEFRLFKGNTRADRLLKAVEYCDALVTYFQEDAGRSLSWDDFVLWLADRVDAYPVLCAYLVEKGVQVIRVPVAPMLGEQVALWPDTMVADLTYATIAAVAPSDETAQA